MTALLLRNGLCIRRANLLFILTLTLLVLSGCTRMPGTAPERSSSTAADTVYTAEGLTLSVPNEYVPLLAVTVADGSGWDGSLFSVHEKASLDAAHKLFGEQTHGGLLFSIGCLSEAALKPLLDADIGSVEVFAHDAAGNYLLCRYPTDVQLVRENDFTDADWAQWSALNDWAASAKDRFLADNPGLIPCA